MGTKTSDPGCASAPAPSPEENPASSGYVPRRYTLDGFATEVAANDGLDIRQADPLTTIVVRTRNSVYRIIPLRPGETRALVQGGQFFPQPTEAHLAGSGFGGSFIKVAWIGIGLHMEINANGERIITSAVSQIGIERDRSATPTPH